MRNAGLIENGKWLRVVLVVPLVVAGLLCGSSSGLAEDQPPDEPSANPAMEGAPSAAPSGETGSPPEAGDVQERGVPQTFRLQNLWKPYEYVNIESGAVAAGPIGPGWLSAQWTLEQASPGHLRIRNVWKPDQYLNIESGALVASAIQPGWLSAQWTLTGVAPPNVLVYRICNVWKPDQCLNVESGALVASAIQPGWLSAQWTLAALAAPVVAAPPTPPRTPPVATPTPPPSSQGPRYAGPTANITAVANAIRYDHKSLSTVVTVPPGLALTLPVTISIGYFPSGVVGYGQDCHQRLTQSYVTLTGNKFLCGLPEGDGQPRRMHVDITLSEPKPGGGLYNYNVPVDMNLTPLYEVTISPLTFQLYVGCALTNEIHVRWYPPGSANYRSFNFSTSGGIGAKRQIGQFTWSRSEVSAAENLHKVAVWYEQGDTSTNVPAPSQENLVPGKTYSSNPGLMTAINDSCQATLDYTVRYIFRHYFGTASQ